jgi:hypothetical protein
VPGKIENVARYLVDRTRSGAMKICPRCSLLSPHETIQCDCGYAFERGARLAAYEPRADRQKGKVIPWRVNWAGGFFGGLPFLAALALRSRNDLPTPEVVRLGCWGGVIAGVFIARWIYRRRLRART